MPNYEKEINNAILKDDVKDIQKSLDAMKKEGVTLNIDRLMANIERVYEREENHVLPLLLKSDQITYDARSLNNLIIAPASTGDHKSLDLILKKDFLKDNDDMNEALMVSSENRQEKTTKMLLQEIERDPRLSFDENAINQTMLNSASLNQPDLLKSILKKIRKDPELKFQGEELNMALRNASKNGDEKSMALVLGVFQIDKSQTLEDKTMSKSLLGLASKNKPNGLKVLLSHQIDSIVEKAEDFSKTNKEDIQRFRNAVKSTKIIDELMKTVKVDGLLKKMFVSEILQEMAKGNNINFTPDVSSREGRFSKLDNVVMDNNKMKDKLFTSNLQVSKSGKNVVLPNHVAGEIIKFSNSQPLNVLRDLQKRVQSIQKEKQQLKNNTRMDRAAKVNERTANRNKAVNPIPKTNKEKDPRM
jgi:hypothetical protein